MVIKAIGVYMQIIWIPTKGGVTILITGSLDPGTAAKWWQAAERLGLVQRSLSDVPWMQEEPVIVGTTGGAFRYIQMHSHTFHILAQASALEKSLLKLIFGLHDVWPLHEFLHDPGS